MYALYLAEDGRILATTYPQYAPADAVIVEALPEGDAYEYRYVDGEYVHDPLPQPEQPEAIIPKASRNITAGEYVTIGDVLYKATTNIPNGGAVIEGQNAVVTTVEEQLYELTKGE